MSFETKLQTLFPGMYVYQTLLVSYYKVPQPYFLLKPPLQQRGPSRLWPPFWRCNETGPHPSPHPYFSLASYPRTSVMHWAHTHTIWKYVGNNAVGPPLTSEEWIKGREILPPGILLEDSWDTFHKAFKGPVTCSYGQFCTAPTNWFSLLSSSSAPFTYCGSLGSLPK